MTAISAGFGRFKSNDMELPRNFRRVGGLGGNDSFENLAPEPNNKRCRSHHPAANGLFDCSRFEVEKLSDGKPQRREREAGGSFAIDRVKRDRSDVLLACCGRVARCRAVDTALRMSFSQCGVIRTIAWGRAVWFRPRSAGRVIQASRLLHPPFGPAN